jgi:hypothetical protein
VGVAAIACYQILKAAALLLTAILLYRVPAAWSSSGESLYALLHLAVRGNVAVADAVTDSGDLVPVIVALWGIYLALVGAGLWKMRAWARWSLIATSGATMALYAISVLVPESLNNDRFSFHLSGADAQSVHILLLIDVFLFVYLLRGNTASSFRERI